MKTKTTNKNESPYTMIKGEDAIWLKRIIEAAKTKEANKIIQSVSETFGLEPSKWACKTAWALGFVSLDPIKLEESLSAKHGKTVPDENQGLKGWIGENYGEEAVDLAIRAIRFHPRTPESATLMAKHDGL